LQQSFRTLVKYFFGHYSNVPMKKLSVFAVLLFGLATYGYGQSILRIDETAITGDSVTNRVEQLRHAAHVSGLCVAIFNDNQLVYDKAFGLANVPENLPLKTSMVFYGASFSKAVFAYIVMRLVDQKVIDLDKPLVEYLPKSLMDYSEAGPSGNYQDLKNDERYKKITARMCLDHTTGFPNWRFFEDDKKLRIKYEPGTHYSYSGEGLCLLQFVIEQITKTDLESIARKNVFEPLGMKYASYIWQNDFLQNLVLGHNAVGKPYQTHQRYKANAAGSLFTSFDDYLKFYKALINGTGLSQSSFHEMLRAQIRIKAKQQFGPEARQNTDDNDNIQLSYGLGLGLMTTPYGRAFFKEGHDDGWQHYSVCFKEKGVAIVIMSNSDNTESIFKPLLAYCIGDTFTPWYWENYIPIGTQKAKPGYAFYCVPCHNDCDTIAHEYSGICPVCKMPLVEKPIQSRH
jgi:D-alanyl-D-alanine-carboxypeptidase/D-alanyl-D-alanine-endopeptidase